MRFKHLSIFALGMLALLSLSASRAEAQTLLWDPSPSADVIGYRVWSGQQRGVYNRQVDVGKVTSHQPTGMDWTKSQFFAIQAYSSAGLSSSMTPEVEWIPSITKLTSLTSNAGNPLLMGRTVTWTAQGSNNLGPVHYQFWLFGRSGWTTVQPYGTSNKFTWTPGWDDQGLHYLQVRARAANSTASYEAALGTNAFSVSSQPMALTSDIEFPTPPGNPVSWTATVAGAGATPLEYKFWVLNPGSGWTPFRDWNASNEAVWTPSAVGTYAVSAWARRVGSTAEYDVYVGASNLVISQTKPVLTALTADRPYPLRTGAEVTWTARARGGTAGPLEYQFWAYSPATGWTIAQPYSESRTFDWTPSWGDGGTRALQVWVRSAGSTPASGYEDYRGTGFFTVERAPLHLTTTTRFPVAPGTPIQWSASVEDPTVTLEYQFWIFRLSTGTWSIAQPYSTDATYVWTPTAGTYAMQVWARQPGSSNAYDQWRGTDMLTVAASTPRVVSITANVPLPATTGTTITWTAGATGGTAPLRYQFWRFDSGSGWTIAQPYGTSKTYTWTPSAGDAGPHAIQVWVKSQGTTPSGGYESYMSSGFFDIQ